MGGSESAAPMRASTRAAPVPRAARGEAAREAPRQAPRETPPELPAWWPHAERSRLVQAGGLGWHVQRWPRPGAPCVLLLHGTGSGTHSWRHLAPLLAERFDVLAPDLPGHAFTRTPPSQKLTLPGVAEALATLLETLGVQPELLCGHSAGAAVALQLVLGHAVRPQRVVSINGALLPLQGPLGRWFQPLAQVLALHPWLPPLFSAWASLPRVAQRLLEGTGSRIDPLGERCYAHLLARSPHAAGALRLMSSWNLEALQAALGHVSVPTLLLAGSADRTLPPAHAEAVHRLMRCSSLVALPGLGHLAHEEAAAAVLAAMQAHERAIQSAGGGAGGR